MNDKIPLGTINRRSALLTCRLSLLHNGAVIRKRTNRGWWVLSACWGPSAWRHKTVNIRAPIRRKNSPEYKAIHLKLKAKVWVHGDKTVKSGCSFIERSAQDCRAGSSKSLLDSTGISKAWVVHTEICVQSLWETVKCKNNDNVRTTECSSRRWFWDCVFATDMHHQHL